ncbi:MAG: biotin/lipoyl-binding protein [Cyclobacteriaceae bacterium]|nr:biotin/lipoyl-binding protein [Cyclobacteriaceae bacterium]
MIEATVNSSKLNITEYSEKFLVNQEELVLDIKKINNSLFHVIHSSKSFNVNVVSIDFNKKKAAIKINGKVCEVSLKNNLDLLLDQMGMTSIDETFNNYVKAPMPGLIIEVVVSAGDKVNRGDILLILEAMKMENAIKSPKDGIVSSVNIKTGESVEKNQILIAF